MAGSAALSNLEDKLRAVEKNVWERKVVFTFATGDTGEVKQAIPKLNGILLKAIVVCSSAAAADVLATVAIDDNADIEIFSVSGLVEGSTNRYNLFEAISRTIDVGVTPSKDPTGAYTVTVYLRGV